MTTERIGRFDFGDGDGGVDFYRQDGIGFTWRCDCGEQGPSADSADFTWSSVMPAVGVHVDRDHRGLRWIGDES